MLDKLIDILTRYRAYIYLILTILTMAGVLYTNRPPVYSPVQAQPMVSLSEFQTLQRENRSDHDRIEEKIDKLLFILVQVK
jgi:hypothetical protein